MSVLGANTRVTGRVGGEGALRIEGNVEGDVAVTGYAEIASGGSVQGDLHAESIEIAGRLTGDAVASGPIAIRAGAELRGDLKGSSISIEPGARVDIRLDTDFSLEMETTRRRR